MDSLDKKEKDFLEVYEQYADSVFRHCIFRVSDREKAKDLVQETFVKTWVYINAGNDISNLKAFVFKVARNLIIDHYRRSKEISLDFLMEAGFDRATHNEDEIFTNAEHSQVKKALDKIKPEYKEMIILRFIEGLSPKEMSEIIGISENVVSVRIHRAIKKLKEKLDP